MHPAQDVGPGFLIDQQQVRLHVAVAVVSPLAAQRVVVVPRIQRQVSCQGFRDGSQDRVKSGPVPASCLPFVDALGAAGPRP